MKIHSSGEIEDFVETQLLCYCLDVLLLFVLFFVLLLVLLHWCCYIISVIVILC